MKKRRLADLYVTGRPCTIKGQKENDVIELWLQKPGPVEHESALRRANAARARVLMYRNDPEAEEWQATYSEASDFGTREQQIDYLVAKKANEKRQTVQARLASEEPWSTDDYLQGLYDAWEGTAEEPGLKDEYARDPDNPDAKQAFESMKAFIDAVDAQVAPEIEMLKEEYGVFSDEQILRQVTDRMLESKADNVWLRELNRSELFYAVREVDNHSRRYFDNRDELDLLDPRIVGQLADAYRELIVDPAEGKDSGATDDSSPSPEPSETVEPPPPSGLVVVSP